MNAQAEDFRKRQSQRRYERLSEVAKMVKHWERQHEAEIASFHPAVLIEVRGLLHELANEAVDRGQAFITLRGERLERTLRQFICRQRRVRHGPQPENAAQWRAQIDALCAEYGWSWVPPKPERLPVKVGERG